MPKALIKISYRQIIDTSTEGSFAKNILNASYEEFKMKSQAYNPAGEFTTFTQLKANDGRANSLHYKCGFPIGGFIDKLNKQIPFLQDAAGQNIEFATYQLEVIESDITNKLLHKVAIHYISDRFDLYEIIGENLLLSKSEAPNEEGAETFILRLCEGLSIIEYKEL